MVNSCSRVIRNKSTLIRFTFFAAWHLWTFISHKSDLAFLLQPHRGKLLNSLCVSMVEKKKALTYLGLVFILNWHYRLFNGMHLNQVAILMLKKPAVKIVTKPHRVRLHLLILLLKFYLWIIFRMTDSAGSWMPKQTLYSGVAKHCFKGAIMIMVLVYLKPL